MATDGGLFALYKLHLVDHDLYEMQAHAAALDVGKQEIAEAKAIEEDPEGTIKRARELAAEQKDIELRQATFKDKRDKIEKDLFGGKIVNPREVAAMEQEIGHLKKSFSDLDDRLLELLDLVPSAQVEAKELEARVAQLRKDASAKSESAKEEHAKLQKRYAARSKDRPAAAAGVSAALLGEYEALRKKLGGSAMALVTKDHRCAHCGMHVPEKAYDMVSRDKLSQCEQCRRILFKLEQST